MGFGHIKLIVELGSQKSEQINMGHPVTQSVEHLTSARVMISWFISLVKYHIMSGDKGIVYFQQSCPRISKYICHILNLAQ